MSDIPKLKIETLLDFADAKRQAKTQLDKFVKEFQEQAKVELGITFNEKDAKNLLSQFEKDTAKTSKTIKKQLRDATTLDLNKSKFGAQLNAWVTSNTKAIPRLGGKIEEIKAQIQSADKVQLGNLQKEFQTVNKQAEALGIRGKTLWQQLKSDLGNFATFVFGGGLIMGSLNSIKQMVSNVIELDTAMTDLYKVTDNTNSEYANFLDTANSKAIQLGSSVKDLVSSTADFAKLGYNLQDSAKLANVATLYSNVGDVDIDTGTKDIVTAMKSFNIQASDAISIVDRLNEVSNKYAVSSADLGEGLKNSASALAVAGNSIDQSIAMLTGMTEITQDASESGNALKVLSLRLRGSSAELSDMGEDIDGVVESTSKLRESIKALSGVDIMKDENTFKSTYQIMDEISKVYNNLTDSSKAGLLETIAGKQRGNQVAALLTNMSQANNALTTSLNSQGSAQKEQDKWMESIEAKTKQFGATFEKVSQQVVDSNFIKGTVDTGTGFLGAVSWLIDKLGTIPTLVTAAMAALSGIKNAGKENSFEYALPFLEAA